MHKNLRKNDEPMQYADILKKVDKQATRVLKDVQAKKSKKWGKDVRYIPDRIWLCHLYHPERNNLCKDNCYDYALCKIYERVRDFFLQYGFILYPYTLSVNGKPISKLHADDIMSMGFYDDSMSNTLFVNSVCFSDSFKDHPVYSALNEAFHELLHATAGYYIEYDVLMASINRDALVKYLSEPNYVDNLLKMYDIQELKTTNEPIHRFIANNKDTKCLLESIFKHDKQYLPPPELSDLHYQLQYLLDKLEDKDSDG